MSHSTTIDTAAADASVIDIANAVAIANAYASTTSPNQRSLP